jgi:DNA-directed RNA polymerase specialized sigma24 family protein
MASTDVQMTGIVKDESGLIAALRDGDEAGFAQLVDRYTPAMLRVARDYVPTHEIAEEVVQETWIALLKGIAKFEGRSSVRTWLFTVMINIAKTRGVRERRDVDAEIAAYTAAPLTPPASVLPTRRNGRDTGRSMRTLHPSPTPRKDPCWATS